MKNVTMKLLFSLFIAIFYMQSQGYAMTTNGNQILNSDGEVVELKGVNWFGFNNQQTMVDGLWNSSNSTAFNFETVVYRMQLLGFNAIRLPFSFTDLYQLPARNFAQSCTLDSISQIQASVTNPGVPVPSGKTIPPMVYPAERVVGQCNNYLPNDSTLNRFLWVVNFFANNGFYVLIDNHFEDRTVLQGTQPWVQSWTRLATEIAKDPISRRMVMLDLLNESDSYGIRWEASGGKPALTDLYLSAMDALAPILPEALFFLEGTGQGGIGANWGDGFATDPTLISQNGLSDPNPFFKSLLTKPYVNQVVISPHVYPPSVTNAQTNFSGTGLWNRLNNSFGYLAQTGYCNGSNCKKFPIAIGEFGSRFTQPNDLAFLSDFASYLNNKGQAADGKHPAIPNFFYWSWNANSGDTGGIVTDDWETIIWEKINYLVGLGLRPWYAEDDSNEPNPPAKTGTLCISVDPVSGLNSNQLRAITAGNYSFTITNFNQSVCQTVAVGNYSITAPTITVGSTQYTAAAVQASVTEGQTTTAKVVYKAIAPKVGILCVSVDPVSGLNTSQLQAITAGNYSFTVTEFSKSVCQSVTVGNYSITAPTITVGNTQYTAAAVSASVKEGQTTTIKVVYKATPIAASGSFIVNVKLGSPWQNTPGGNYINTINLDIQNTGKTDVNVPWSIKVYNPDYTAINSVWNINLDSFSKFTMNGTTSAGNTWQTLQANKGNTVSFGMIASSKTKSFIPKAIKINGVAATINLVP